MRRNWQLAAAATICFTALSLDARAVVQTSGDILISGLNAEVDLWYFTIGGTGGTTRVQLDPRAPSGLPGVLTVEDMGFTLYTEVGGTLGALLGSAGLPGGDRGALLDIDLVPGDYIAVVSWSTLSPGEFGPTQNDPNVQIPIEDYEVSLTGIGSNDAVFTCGVLGKLDGTYTITKFDPGSDCIAPAAAAVPAPATLPLLAGAIGLAGLALRRRA